jgi:hypothetical protein
MISHGASCRYSLLVSKTGTRHVCHKTLCFATSADRWGRINARPNRTAMLNCWFPITAIRPKRWSRSYKCIWNTWSLLLWNSGFKTPRKVVADHCCQGIPSWRWNEVFHVDILYWGLTNTGSPGDLANESCGLEHNIRGFSVLNLLHDIPVVSTILRQFLDFQKISSPL